MIYALLSASAKVLYQPVNLLLGNIVSLSLFLVSGIKCAACGLER